MKAKIKIRILCVLFDLMKKLFEEENSLDLTIHVIEEDSVDVSIWQERKDIAVSGKCFQRIKAYDDSMFDITIFTKERKTKDVDDNMDDLLRDAEDMKSETQTSFIKEAL